MLSKNRFQRVQRLVSKSAISQPVLTPPRITLPTYRSTSHVYFTYSSLECVSVNHDGGPKHSPRLKKKSILKLTFFYQQISKRSIFKIDQNQLIFIQHETNDASSFILYYSGHFHVRPTNDQKNGMFYAKRCHVPR